MADTDNANRLLCPKPCELPQGRRFADATEQSTFSKSTNQSTPALRRPKAPVKTDKEWNASREDIQKLYLVDDFSLWMVIEIMGANHGFWAS